MYTRGVAVLEVALIIGMFGAIATFTTLHQEVARVQAEAQYAQAAAAQGGGAPSGGTGNTGGQSGEQRVCVNGEKYEATIKDGKAEFRQVTAPLTTQPAQPCSLTFEIDPEKHTTATVQVPPGGDLDKARSTTVTLNEKSNAFSSATAALQTAQRSGDAAAIQTAANNALVAGRELNQALDAAYAGNTQDPVYQAASNGTATALGALHEITQDPSAANASDVERITRGLSSIETARVAALGTSGNAVRLSDANNSSVLDSTGMAVTAGLTNTPTASFNNMQLADTTFGNTTGSAEPNIVDSGLGSQQEPDVGITNAIQRAEQEVTRQAERVQALEEERNSLFHRATRFIVGEERADIAINAEIAQANEALIQAQQNYERLLTTTSLSEYDYGGSGVYASSASINVQGETQNTVSALNAAVSEVRQSISGLPAFLGSGYQYVVQNIAGNTNTGNSGTPTGSTNTTNTGNTNPNPNPNPTNTSNPAGGNTGNPPGNSTGNPPGAGQYPYTPNTGGMVGGQQAQCQALQQRCTPSDQSGCAAYAQLCGGAGAGMGGMNMPRPAAGGSGASGSSQQQQNVCAQYPGTTLQNGQCACASGQSWNGSACAAANACARYPGTTLQNNQCTCPAGQSWNGSQCAADSASGLKAELVCAPQTQEVGEPIAISWMCQNATNKRVDGFTVDESASVLSGTAQVTASTTAGQSTMQFSLTCLKEGQTHQAQCSVEVVKPFIVLVATPSTVASGGSVRVGWVTGGMRNTSDACSLTSEELPSVVHTATAGVVDIPNITQETTFTLTCTTRTGGPKTGEVTVSLE